MATDKKTEKKTESQIPEAKKYAAAYADDQEISENEAMARLAVKGWNRLKALKKDNMRREKGLKPQHRKVTVQVIGEKKAAAKPKAKKVAKKAKAKTSTANGAAAHA